ncbi:DUF6714 family protein [Motilimonas sp. E26]|uniref:DUF6714 family protein n=1 Tax=Motilimonas sp. E26 TaxID=2865674 RepID=UPI001E4BF18B|nr:DUF6714 family protein [Motilimonas sp. E26]MCE0556492.1 hypothetical protein [Motilimonas sp. E26]
MEYLGYKTQEMLLEYLDIAFPYVPKPSENDLLIFSDEDIPCRCIRLAMKSYQDERLPKSGVRYLHSELSNLSSKGMQWLLPSYLRAAICCEDQFDTLTSEVIYDFELSSDASLRSRYAFLNKEQIHCLAAIFEYLSEIHGHRIAEALDKLERLSE